MLTDSIKRSKHFVCVWTGKKEILEHTISTTHGMRVRNNFLPEIERKRIIVASLSRHSWWQSCYVLWNARTHKYKWWSGFIDLVFFSFYFIVAVSGFGDGDFFLFSTVEHLPCNNSKESMSKSSNLKTITHYTKTNTSSSNSHRTNISRIVSLYWLNSIQYHAISYLKCRI